jgi:hypothetical protein
MRHTITLQTIRVNPAWENQPDILSKPCVYDQPGRLHMWAEVSQWRWHGPPSQGKSCPCGISSHPTIQAACLFSEVVDLFDNASLPFRGNYFWYNILDIRFAPTHMDTEYGFSLSYRPVRQPGKLNQLVSAWSDGNWHVTYAHAIITCTWEPPHYAFVPICVTWDHLPDNHGYYSTAIKLQLPHRLGLRRGFKLYSIEYYQLNTRLKIVMNFSLATLLDLLQLSFFPSIQKSFSRSCMLELT